MVDYSHAITNKSEMRRRGRRYHDWDDEYDDYNGWDDDYDGRYRWRDPALRRFNRLFY